jgi:hypothetical protein
MGAGNACPDAGAPTVTVGTPTCINHDASCCSRGWRSTLWTRHSERAEHEEQITDADGWSTTDSKPLGVALGQVTKRPQAKQQVGDVDATRVVEVVHIANRHPRHCVL